MTKGISFDFDSSGKLKFEEPENRKDCFGGVVCEHAEHEDYNITLIDDSIIPARTYFCKHVNKPVTSFMWTNCPIGRWMYLKNYNYSTGAESKALDCLWGKKDGYSEPEVSEPEED